MADNGSAQRVPVTRDSKESPGDYRLLAKLGSGGQADVYLALSRGPMDVKRLVVVKRLRSAHEFHEEHVTMFLDEARLAARLAHPNVVTTYEVGHAAKGYFIAMEYLDGQPLEQVMRAPGAGKTFTHRMWAAIAADALAGLHYAHELADYDGTPLGIVHRDVSPHNIFLTYSGETKVVDFGVAKASLNTVRTETGVLKGKITYMSPEQARGAQTDRRSDLFAMGIILWEAVTGKRLFVGDPLQILHKLINDTVPAASLTEPAVHPTLDAIITRAVASSVNDRFQTAEEMRKALEAYIRETGEPIQREDLGAALTAMFGEAHARVREKIAAHLTNVGSGGSHKITSLSESEPEVPELSEIIQAGRTTSRPDSLQAREVEAKPRPRRSLAATGAVLALVAGVVLVAARMGGTTKKGVDTRPSATATSVAPALRHLKLTSEPPEAEVTWNGQPMGHTPLSVELPTGPQTLIVTKQGYDDEPVVVGVQPDEGDVVQKSVTLRAQGKAAAAPPAAPALPAGHAGSKAKGSAHLPPGTAPAPSAAPEEAPSAAPAASASQRRVTPKDNW